MGPAGFQDKALERQRQFASWRACKVAEPGEARQPAALRASGITAEGGQLGWTSEVGAIWPVSSCGLQKALPFCRSPGDPPLPRSRSLQKEVGG